MDIEIIKEISEYHFVNLTPLNDDSIIVDAGAAWGRTLDSLRNFTQTRNCKIFAIDCNRDHIKTLRAKKYQNVVIHEVALVGQNSDDTVTFYQHLGLPGWGNIIKPRGGHHRKFKGIREYKVDTLKINNLFAFLGVDKIDYFKMDIEGSEKEIIETMSEETASKIKQWSIEFHFPFGDKIRESLEARIKSFGFETIKKERKELLCERR